MKDDAFGEGIERVHDAEEIVQLRGRNDDAAADAEVVRTEAGGRYFAMKACGNEGSIMSLSASEGWNNEDRGSRVDDEERDQRDRKRDDIGMSAYRGKFHQTLFANQANN